MMACNKKSVNFVIPKKLPHADIKKQGESPISSPSLCVKLALIYQYLISRGVFVFILNVLKLHVDLSEALSIHVIVVLKTGCV